MSFMLSNDLVKIMNEPTTFPVFPRVLGVSLFPLDLFLTFYSEY